MKTNKSKEKDETSSTTASGSAKSESKITQVRGESLRKKMEESEEYGEKFREKNQGHDVLDHKIKHSDKESQH